MKEGIGRKRELDGHFVDYNGLSVEDSKDLLQDLSS